MNRIILIGNGFDIAHGLPTKYSDFINDFWTNIIKEAKECHSCDYTRYGITITSTQGSISELIKKHNALEYSDLQNTVDKKGGYVTLTVENNFLKLISKKVDKSWVDIEEMYYKELVRSTNDQTSDYYKNTTKLNADFLEIENLLEKYLSKTQYEKHPVKAINNIKANIFTILNFRDFSQSHSFSLNMTIKHEVEKISRMSKSEITKHVEGYFKEFNEEFNINISEIDSIQEFIERQKQSKDKDANLNKEIRRSTIPDYFNRPTDTLFLNFNYTETIRRYCNFNIPINTKFFINIEIINIHGELDNPKNPMIFGYGDELDDDYKTLENRKENHLLENMKSIKYLETDNYRRLLSFIESEPYQVLIGHSCGNSDRTLLNTLFEHKNCVSIKPYCYIDDDGKDNYSEIVRNISRNFKDKQSMRDKVVNKTFCTTLAQGDLT